MTTILEQALRLARRGLPVFPCRVEDKRPVHTGGFHNATADPEDVGSWCWDETRLIGVPTGSMSGIAVLDVDPRNGGDDWLSANKRRLPYTRAHETRSGGVHILFRQPDGLRNSAGLIGPGIDVRGDGGYVIWWPAHGCMIIDHLPLAELAPWPSWLLERRRRRLGREKPVRQSRGLSRYGEAALDNACRRILGAPPGQQEITANGEAYSIGRLAGAGALPVDFAVRALQFAAERIASYDGARPWRGGELAAKVERSFNDGMRNPRTMTRR